MPALRDVGQDGAHRSQLLLARRRLRELAIVFAVAALAPLTDAALALGAGATAGTLTRHAGILLYLLATSAALLHAARTDR